MSFRSRLVHALAIVTPSTTGSTDAYGQPVAGDPVTVTVSGLIQPKRANEVAQTNQAGAIVADHVVFLEPQTLAGSAYIRFDPDDGDRYEIVGVRGFDFGRSPHLEVDVKRIVSETLAAEVS